MSVINLPKEESSFQTEVLDSKIPVVVIFSASWCGPCKVLKETLKEVTEDLESSNSINKIKFIVIDVDEHLKLAAKYSIRSVPNIMLFSNQEIKEDVKGAIPKATLLQLVNKYI